MRNWLIALLLPLSLFCEDFLPSWNAGPAKEAIIKFVEASKDLPPEEKIAAFDNDGTLWVEQPLYTQVVYALDQTGFKGDYSKLTKDEIYQAVAKAFSGMSTEALSAQVENWLKTAKHPRWNKPYTDLTYQPMLELLKYLRMSGFKTYIVTGGGQDFVRAFAEKIYGIPPEQVIGSMGKTLFTDKDGKAELMKEPKLILNTNYEGKPEGIYLMIGRRPQAAFGNSDGDRQMLEYTEGNKGLMMLVLHDDAEREYAYGPATGLPDSKVGTFSESLYQEAKKRGWTVISMKKEWKQIFSFER